MINIQEILITALQDRYIFHSEADFQHHLAWYVHTELQLHTELQQTKLRLEYPLSKNDSNRREYCDIILKSPCNIGIELKYKTKLLIKNIGDECFELKDQKAIDTGRYDFLKDVQRLETWCNKNMIDIGYAILLTNDEHYWSAPRKDTNDKEKDTNDKEFRLHNRKVKGSLRWGEEASAGTMKSRESAITLKNEYSLEWNDVLGMSSFKYLLLQVKC